MGDWDWRNSNWKVFETRSYHRQLTPGHCETWSDLLAQGTPEVDYNRFCVTKSSWYLISFRMSPCLHLLASLTAWSTVLGKSVARSHYLLSEYIVIASSIQGAGEVRRTLGNLRSWYLLVKVKVCFKVIWKTPPTPPNSYQDGLSSCKPITCHKVIGKRHCPEGGLCQSWSSHGIPVSY